MISPVRSFSLSWWKKKNGNNISRDNSSPFPEGKEEKSLHLRASFILWKYVCAVNLKYLLISLYLLKSDINTRCISRHLKYLHSPCLFISTHAGGYRVPSPTNSLPGWYLPPHFCSRRNILLISHHLMQLSMHRLGLLCFSKTLAARAGGRVWCGQCHEPAIPSLHHQLWPPLRAMGSLLELLGLTHVLHQQCWSCFPTCSWTFKKAPWASQQLNKDFPCTV